MNAPSDSVVIISPSANQFWNDLPPEGKQIQARLLPEIDRFAELLRALTRNLPRSLFTELEAALEDMQSAVEQNRGTWWTTRDEAVDGFRRLIDKVITTLEDYHGTSFSRVLAISDTSALAGESGYRAVAV